MRIYTLFLLLLSSAFAVENVDPKVLESRPVFFQRVSSLFQEGKWEELALLGEKALEEGVSEPDRFIVLDQLVSTYFYLGFFEKAKEKANELVVLGEVLHKPEGVVDSLYKLSAALRGAADSEKDLIKQRELFSESLLAIEKAFVICEEKCSENKALRARVLFNRGAVLCDDPIGNVSLGIGYYKEAVALFKELKEIDFTQRMLIRLGKAYFFVRDFEQSRAVIEELKKENLEKRTYMHLLYLDAQVCLQEGNVKEALSLALQGQEIAIFLHAQHDEKRFGFFIEKIEKLFGYIAALS